MSKSDKPVKEPLREAYNALLAVRPWLTPENVEKCNVALAIVCELAEQHQEEE